MRLDRFSRLYTHLCSGLRVFRLMRTVDVMTVVCCPCSYFDNQCIADLLQTKRRRASAVPRRTVLSTTRGQCCVVRPSSSQPTSHHALLKTADWTQLMSSRIKFNVKYVGIVEAVGKSRIPLSTTGRLLGGFLGCRLLIEHTTYSTVTVLRGPTDILRCCMVSVAQLVCIIPWRSLAQPSAVRSGSAKSTPTHWSLALYSFLAVHCMQTCSGSETYG